MIPCPLRQQAEANPNAIAIMDGERKWTFNQWHLEAEKWAFTIKNIGVEKGRLYQPFQKILSNRQLKFLEQSGRVTPLSSKVIAIQER